VKTIVAPLTFGFDEAASLPAVISTAKALDAHLDAIFMRPDPETAFFYSGMLPSETFEEVMRQEMEESGKAAALTSRRRFARLCRKAGVASAQKPRRADAATARWREEKGDPASIFPAIARTADLAIFSGQTAASDFLRGSLLEATLLGSGNPVLYLPEAENGAVFNHPLIAWDGGTACVRAISAWLSMGFTPQQATILCIVDPGEDMPQPHGLENRLAWHGIKARTEKRNRGFDTVADALIAAAQELECGMIVMGGYGRFRYSEALFGGVTRGVMQRSRIPVLMMH
jgi:nucleotide-binding universal stress UspA family protein